MRLRFTCFLLLLNVAAFAQTPIKWPGNKKAVIVLTYDDAMESQLNVAVPQLTAAGLKGTFFITGDIDSETIPKWRALSKKGFELGNHTAMHPCDSTNDNPVISNHYTVDGILYEIKVMNHFLYAVDGKNSRTYAYPCTETAVGGKDYTDSLRKAGIIKYARMGGDIEAVITDFKKLDPMRVPSYALDDNTTPQQLITYVKNVQKSGGMGIFMFHGIGSEYLITSAAAHQQLLDYLKQNSNDIWVTTFQQAMDYVTEAGKKP